MADVLLTHVNHLYADPKQVRKMQPYPPLQTLIAAACLRSAGHDVAFFDSTFDEPRGGFEQALAQHRPRLVAVVEDNFNFLTKMCLTANRELAFDFCQVARQAGAALVISGSDSSDHTDLYLRAGATAVITGETEATLVEAAGRCTAGQGFAGVSGLQALPSEHATPTGPRARVEDLDSLPHAAWDLVDLEPYRRAWRKAHGRFSLNLVSSRGCPYRCNWCAKPIFGDQYSHRSPRATAEEMHLLKSLHGAEHVWFADDIFALRADWTRAFADEVEQLDAQLPFKMQSRCGLMTRDTAADLKRAGCEEVWMGAESGSQTVLDAMDKDTSVEQIAAARENLRRHGIRACYFLQFGYPGETWKDIEKTVEMVRRTKPDDIGVSVSYPLPGTAFHDRVVNELGLKQNWTHSDDLAMMFQGEYSTDFYKHLRDALHHEVEVLNGRSVDGGRAEALWQTVGGAL